jgi:hypothetical protein
MHIHHQNVSQTEEKLEPLKRNWTVYVSIPRADGKAFEAQFKKPSLLLHINDGNNMQNDSSFLQDSDFFWHL